MIEIPIQPTASQILSVVLGGQFCQFNIFSKFGTLYIDVYVSNNPILLGVQCENLNRIVRSAYLGFLGDLIFADTQGNADPVYTGLGSQYLFMYLETSDLANLGFDA